VASIAPGAVERAAVKAGAPADISLGAGGLLLDSHFQRRPFPKG